jgi:hypothetical protein
MPIAMRRSSSADSISKSLLGLGPHLTRTAQIPAVVAMRYEIADPEATDGEGPESPPLNVRTEVGAFIAGCSKHAALEAHHAAMEAARLRAPQASEVAEQDHVPSSSVPASSLIDRARASAKRGAAEVTEQLRRLRDQGKIDDNGSILVAWPDDMNAGSSTDL